MSNKNPLEDKLLNIKKAKFLETVEKTAKSIGVPVPHAKFWDDKCPYGSEDEDAHIHPEMLIICISEKRLSEMTYEEIEYTASHEVEHLRDKIPEFTQIHSREFYERHARTLEKNWRPESPGVITIRGNEKLKKYRKPKPFKADKTRCNNYHRCNKKIGLKQCTLCKRFFCEDHITPSEPHVGAGGREFNFIFNHHPCPEYAILPDSKKIEFKVRLAGMLNYEEALKEWKEEIDKINNKNKEIKKKYEDKLKKWKTKCQKKFIGFFIKIFEINKPKLSLVKKPLEPKKPKTYSDLLIYSFKQKL